MQTTSLLATVAALFTALTAFAEPAVHTVASIKADRETRATAAISPTSSLSPAIANFAAAKIAPMIAGTQVFSVVPTGSMRPAFDNNTVLLTEPAPFENLQVGDIVVFRHRGTGARIVHRILERRGSGYWTKGDHNARMDDELVTRENYLGRVYGILYTSRGGAKPMPESLRRSPALLASTR
jgi:signal peptidase I